MTDLEALAARVEGATAADRMLDALVAAGHDRNLAGTRFASAQAWADEAIRERWNFPAYTASLDAAMSLGEGCVLVAMSDIAADGLPGVCLCSDTSTSPPAEHWGIALARGSRQEQLARAYTAAALRARAHLTAGATHDR